MWVVLWLFRGMRKTVRKIFKKSTDQRIFHEQQFKFAYISVMNLDQTSTLFKRNQENSEKTPRFSSY